MLFSRTLKFSRIPTGFSQLYETIPFLQHDIIPALFKEVIKLARQRGLLSEGHFSVGEVTD